MIKICGVRTVDVARAAIDAGASAIGFMLAPSRRQVTPSDVAMIMQEIESPRIAVVGVVVNETAAAINDMVRAAGLDVAQLSGDESPDLIDDLDLPAWKTVRFAAGTMFDVARRELERWLDRARPPQRLLVDAAVPGHYGGSGVRADWDLAARLASEYPLVLAGGLDPENVAEAITSVRPAGVDVSSGVETDGGKDVAKIGQFVARGLTTFGALRAQSSR